MVNTLQKNDCKNISNTLKCYNYSDGQSPIPRTEEYRARLSESLKDWWSVPENKDRMRLIQTGTHRRG
jgi:hypothetical protein